MRFFTPILIAALLVLFGASSLVWAETQQETKAQSIKAAEKARDAAGRAIEVAGIASSAAVMADDAAKKARSLPPSKRAAFIYAKFNYVGEFKYVGTSRKRLPHGYGVIQFTEVAGYEGEFREGAMQGYGVFVYPDGTRYNGQFRGNEFNGYGVFTFADGGHQAGEFLNHKANGFGVGYYASGNRYEGEFHNGDKDGFGVHHFKNGDRHEGENRANSMSGYGTTFFPDGDELYAYWQDADTGRERTVFKSELEALVTATAEVDQSPPEIRIAKNLEASAENFTLRVTVVDKSGIGKVEIAGKKATLAPDGTFEATLYVPRRGKEVGIFAADIHGNDTSTTVSIARAVDAARQSIGFAALNPTTIASSENGNAIALVIGIGDYEAAPDAPFADRDAEIFADFVHRAFGVPNRNIQLLLDKDASRLGVKKMVKRWLPGMVQADKTDVYVFFAGHGLASADGNNLYLLPENGLPDLLEDSAIMRNEIYDALTAANPRSVTVFLDTCFSGGTRGEEMLITDARPILVKARDDRLAPERFTIFTASAGNEISSSLPEAKHGLFSYFLMKGMEGEADVNADRQITAGELHAYVMDNVSRQAVRLGRVQTPQLQGDAERVLMTW